MSDAVNEHVSTYIKLCIVKAIHRLIMTGFVTFHMQDSGQYSVSTEGWSPDAGIDKRNFYASIIQLLVFYEKQEEQATAFEKLLSQLPVYW